MQQAAQTFGPHLPVVLSGVQSWCGHCCLMHEAHWSAGMHSFQHFVQTPAAHLPVVLSGAHDGSAAAAKPTRATVMTMRERVIILCCGCCGLLVCLWRD